MTKSPNGKAAPERSNAAAWPRRTTGAASLPCCPSAARAPWPVHGLPTPPPACSGSGRCPWPWGHAGSSSKGMDKCPRGLDRGATSITQPQLPPPHSWGAAGTPRTSRCGLTRPGDSLNLSERVAHWQPPRLSRPRRLPASSGDALLPAGAGPWVCRTTVLGTELHLTQGDSQVRGSRCLFPWDHWGRGGGGPLHLPCPGRAAL